MYHASTSFFARKQLRGRVFVSGESPPAGADFALACHGGRLANSDFDWFSGYLPYGDANASALSLAPLASGAGEMPVLAGLACADPFRSPELLLREVCTRGFAGVCNYPCVGMMDGSFRPSEEQWEFGFDHERAFLVKAKEAGLKTLAFVFDRKETSAILGADLDGIIYHPGPKGYTFEDSLDTLAEIRLLTPQEIPLFCAGLSGRDENVAHSLLNRFHISGLIF